MIKQVLLLIFVFLLSEAIAQEYSVSTQFQTHQINYRTDYIDLEHGHEYNVDRISFAAGGSFEFKLKKIILSAESNFIQKKFHNNRFPQGWSFLTRGNFYWNFIPKFGFRFSEKFSSFKGPEITLLGYNKEVLGFNPAEKDFSLTRGVLGIEYAIGNYISMYSSYSRGFYGNSVYDLKNHYTSIGIRIIALRRRVKQK